MKLESKRISYSIVTIAILILFLLCESPKPKVQFWPQNAVRTKDSDYAVDSSLQLLVLQRSDSEKDAKMAFKNRDLRLIGDRPSLPRIFGPPDDELTEDILRRYGCKMIATSEELLKNEQFKQLKHNYEERYNSTIYELIRRSEAKAPTNRK